MSAPASTRCGSKRARGADDGVDRLSSLPDEMLHCVMSFLPMPEVVHTSVLSPRWRNLWASTPYIRIDFKDDNKLKDFGNNLLLSRDSIASLIEARIIAHGAAGTSCPVWIRHVIKRRVCHLHVSGSVFLDSTAMVPSRHLKTIRLQSNALRYGFFRPLNDDCPVLELLELEDCLLFDLKEISSKSLQVLHIIGCNITKGLLICASNLTHLSILDTECHSGDILIRDLSSLVTASVRFTDFDYEGNTIVGHGLLDGLSHATTLEWHALKLAFGGGLLTCPMFSNLTSLVLGDWCMATDFEPLLRILQRSPKLKELTFKLRMDSESTLPPSRAALRSGSHCCIERIKIYCWKEGPSVGALVQA